MSEVVPSDHDIILTLGEDLPVGLWIARVPGGELVYANKMFAEIMGMGARDDVAAGGYADPYGICLRDGKPYPEHKMPFVRALEEKRVVVCDDIMIRRHDGTTVDVRAFAKPVGTPITHVIIQFFDVTREVKAEAARAESEKRLQSAQRLEAIGTLAGGIAHDFNNLICGIKLITAELMHDEDDGKRLESLRLVDDITERSAALTRSLLGFARRGKHRSELLVFDDIVVSMREMLRRTLTGVTIEFELLAGRGGIVQGDASQLEQVVMNLVVNARDAVNSTGTVAVRTLVKDGCVVLEVADNGPGIPEELRARVFEPYFTTKTKGAQRGTGLGLATVHGIAEQHGGSCEIGPGLEDRGVTLRVKLPAASLPATEKVRAPRETTVAARPAVTGTVLVVDDDPIVRGAVAQTVDALGYRAEECESGATAVAMYRAQRDEITAIVLDMTMPGMNGKATYLALREIDPGVAVLLMSGYTHNEEVQEILDLGVRAFISKPYSVETLATELDAVHVHHQMA